MGPIEILHLEDSDLDADLIRAWLTRDGVDANIHRATGPDEFLDALRSRHYALILADHSLPNYDGLSALELARKVAPDTPFLFVSGMMGEEVAIETLKRGATDYVLKQRLERLAPAVRRALAESQEREERRRAEIALRDGEVQHRRILDSITDYAVVTADTEGHILSWSAGAQRVFGPTEPEMRGKPLDILYTPEDAADSVPSRDLDRARLGSGGEHERWYCRADGTRFWGSGVVVPLTDESGRLRGYTKVVRDVTERKRAEDALREADRRKDEFLAMLAHELRNPLAAISNAVRLSRRPDLSLDQTEWTKQVVAHQVQHLAHLVDDLLDVSRITRGTIRLRKRVLAIPDVVQNAVETTRTFLEERGHALTVTVGQGSMRVDGDPTRLEQVFVNLLSNAAKYTERGGRVAVSVGREGDQVVVSVRDNGLGMSPDLIGRVFDLFSQADDSLDRTRGGLGIGLTIVRKLVQMHGGTIAARSDGPGRGSEFRVGLPAAPELPEGATARAPRRGAEDGHAASTRILVVDDNIQTARSLAELLRYFGHNVATAHDGAEAIETARRERPDVVLLDIGLPVVDGYQVARTLRHEDGFEDALIVAITGYGEEQSRKRSREAGFDHHLVKPVDFDHLRTLLERKPHRPEAVDGA